MGVHKERNGYLGKVHELSFVTYGFAIADATVRHAIASQLRVRSRLCIPSVVLVEILQLVLHVDAGFHILVNMDANPLFALLPRNHGPGCL